VHLALRPFELARHAVAAVPGVVGSLAEKGCAQIADAPDQIKKLQALGEMAVNMGRRRLRRKVGARINEVRRTAGDLADRTFGNGYAPMATAPAATVTAAAPPPAASPKPPAPKPAAPPPPAASPKPPAPKRPVPKRSLDVTRLPIPDYDALSASQVTSRLAGLSADELEAVRAYEAANRARKTVLAAVDRHRPS
jgi:hypothetical protein